jgi:hypothetical protein
MERKDSFVLSPTVIVRSIVSLFKTLGRNWKLLLLFTAIGVGVGIYMEIEKPQHVRYVSNVTFNISNNQQGMGGMGDLAMMMGMGKNADANLFAGNNFMYFAKSKPILEKAMLTEVDVNGKKTLFVNYYMDSSNVVEDFLKKEAFDYKYRFKDKNRASMTTMQRKLFDRIYWEIYQETRIELKDPTMTILWMSVAMTNEMLSKTWADIMLTAIEDSYQDNQNRKSKKMLSIMKRRVDSLGYALTRTENRLARVTGINEEAVAFNGLAEQGRLARNNNFQSGLYMEAAKSYETLQMTLIRETPLFTVIEPPTLPLDIQFYLPSRAIFGFLIGLIVGIIIISFKEAYQAALKAEKAAT